MIGMILQIDEEQVEESDRGFNLFLMNRKNFKKLKKKYHKNR